MEVLNFSFKFCLFFLPDVIFPFVLDQMESTSPLFYSILIVLHEIITLSLKVFDRQNTAENACKENS